MQRGWGEWSPFAGSLPELSSSWRDRPADEQVADRPYDDLAELDLVLGYAARFRGPVLDLACGSGRFAVALARRGYEVVGLDFNGGFIERAREEAAHLDLPGRSRVRFEVADARGFTVPERFGLVIMMDQAFKYLITHDDQLDCLHAVREHLRDDGRFLVEQRCLLHFPESGPGETSVYERRGRSWGAVDTYDMVEQLSVIAAQPVDEPDAEPELDPCRDFTYQELALLHRVAGFELDEVIHDLNERVPGTPFFDAAFLLKKCDPWRPRRFD